MSNPVAFFAIHADEPTRARRFYEAVFGWTFEPWGPPDFYLIDTGAADVRGALQRRLEPLTGTGMRGYECSISVESVDDIAEAIVQHGGSITHDKTAIPGVGWVVNFLDTEGNQGAAVTYEQRPS